MCVCVQEGTVFGKGAKLGDGNKLSSGVEFDDDAVLGVKNDVGEDAVFGKVSACVAVKTKALALLCAGLFCLSQAL